MVARKTRSKLAGQLARFVQQYARRAHKAADPNDRAYDRKVEQKMKRMRASDLSDLLSGDDIAPSEPQLKKKRDA